ncbi:MAG: nitroreductase family protein, partial [Mailhella sp.]|nr:nitroreductase family protein [Mailhella sp.]
ARGRRSVRAFKDAPVPREVLLRALDCARYAPTGKNLENVTWLVVEGKARLRRIADAVVDFSRDDEHMAGVVRAHDSGHDPIFRDAPCAVFALADSKYDLSACNCDIAVSYLELALPTLGLGACWAGFAMRAAIASPEVRAAFGAPEGLTPFAGLMVGLPKLKYSRIPARRELRVTWLSDKD